MVAEVSFDAVKGALGSLLLLWVSVEKAVRAPIADAHDGQVPKSAYGIAAALTTWADLVTTHPKASPMRRKLASTLRCQIQPLLDIRNGICHGLRGISSSDGDQPASLSWNLGEAEHSITWNVLQSHFKWLSKVPFAVVIISDFSSDLSAARLTDTRENRAWWREEYGIDLPDTPVSPSYEIRQDLAL